jgi:membrane protein insertase Oxa1/YidC/SpoIIIJ
MSPRTTKILAIILLVMFLPAALAVLLAIFVHPLFLTLLLAIVFAVPLIRAARG